MTRPLWTIDALNREHPLLDGWRWELWDNGISPVAMHRDGTFCAVMEGGPFGEGLAAVADDGSFCSAPLDVVLAVASANKDEDPAAALRRQLEHYRKEARRAVAVQWATAHDSVHVWVDEDSAHDAGALTMRLSDLGEALGDSVILITALQLRRLLES